MSELVIPPSTLWAVGQFRVANVSIPWEVSHAELATDARVAAEILRGYGAGPKGRVLSISLLSEAAYWWPFQMACMGIGAQFSYADASPFDAYRVEMFLRRLEFGVVLGVTGAVLDGLETGGHSLATVFGGVPIVVAEHSCAPRLRDVGIESLVFVALGPALAFERAPGEGPVLAASQWSIEPGPESGELLVSSASERATRFERQPTGRSGRAERVGDFWRVTLTS